MKHILLTLGILLGYALLFCAVVGVILFFFASAFAILDGILKLL